MKHISDDLIMRWIREVCDALRARRPWNDKHEREAQALAVHSFGTMELLDMVERERQILKVTWSDVFLMLEGRHPDEFRSAFVAARRNRDDELKMRQSHADLDVSE